jgi:hypothetical protein
MGCRWRPPANAGHFLDEKGARGPQRGAAKPVAWFHATVIAYATDFDSTSAMTATCSTCRKGPAEPDIDRDDTKPGHARGVRYSGESPAGRARCGILPSVEHHR